MRRALPRHASNTKDTSSAAASLNARAAGGRVRVGEGRRPGRRAASPTRRRPVLTPSAPVRARYRPGIMMWAPDVPSFMTHAVAALGRLGRPSDSPVACGVEMVTWGNALSGSFPCSE